VWPLTGDGMLKPLSLFVLCASFMMAETITFDDPSFPPGPFAVETYDGVTFSASGGAGTLYVLPAPNGTLALLEIRNKEMRADIIGGATSVSVDLGDFGEDPDTIFLEIFDVGDNLLGFATQQLDASFIGMVTLSLKAPDIDHAVFGSRVPGVVRSSVLADNFTYESAVPEPATLLLVGPTMLGLLVAFARRRSAPSVQ
jgi:hypothetical protein